MQCYRLLPSANLSWLTSSVDRVRSRRTSTQSRLDDALLARLETTRLFAVSTFECALHMATAVAKLSVAVIQLPLCPFFGGVTPRVALIDAGSHLAHAAKLVPTTPASLFVGLLCPDWSVSLYQRFSLVKEPKGKVADGIERISKVATVAWKRRYCGAALLGSATAIITLVSRTWFDLKPSSRLLSPISGGLSGIALGLGIGALWHRHTLAQRLAQKNREEVREKLKEPFLRVMTFLSPDDLGKMMGTCKLFTRIAIDGLAWKAQCARLMSPLGHQRAIENLENREDKSWAYLRLVGSWKKKREPWTKNPVRDWPENIQVISTRSLSDGSFATMAHISENENGLYIWRVDETGRIIQSWKKLPASCSIMPLKNKGRFIIIQGDSASCYVADANGILKEANKEPVPFTCSDFRYILPLDTGDFLVAYGEAYTINFEKRDSNGILDKDFAGLAITAPNPLLHIIVLKNESVVTTYRGHPDVLDLWKPGEKTSTNVLQRIVGQGTKIEALTALSDGGFATASSDNIIVWDSNGYPIRYHSIKSIWESDAVLRREWVVNIQEWSAGRLFFELDGTAYIFEPDGTSVQIRKNNLGSYAYIDRITTLVNLNGGCMMSSFRGRASRYLSDGSEIVKFNFFQKSHGRNFMFPFFLPLSERGFVSQYRSNKAPTLWLPDMQPLVTARSKNVDAAATLSRIVRT